MSVGVGEESALKHFVGRSLDSRHKVGRLVSHLLDFSEVVLRISIQDHFADFDQRELFVWPHL